MKDRWSTVWRGGVSHAAFVKLLGNYLYRQPLRKNRTFQNSHLIQGPRPTAMQRIAGYRHGTETSKLVFQLLVVLRHIKLVSVRPKQLDPS